MKPDTYTKLYIHCVFTPKGRESVLSNLINSDLYKYIYGIIKEKGCYPVIINGMPDHIHMLFGLNPKISIADLVRDIKRSSSLYINEKKNSLIKFRWQEGYGAFSVGYRDLDNVYQYILNQQKHHEKARFKDEYTNILTKEGVKYNNAFLYEFYDFN